MKEEGLWARGKPSPAAQAAGEGTYIASGTVASPLRLRPSPGISHFLVQSRVPQKSTTCHSDYGILLAHDKRMVWCRTQGSGQFAGGSKTGEPHPGFIKQAFSHPASFCHSN